MTEEENPFSEVIRKLGVDDTTPRFDRKLREVPRGKMLRKEAFELLKLSNKERRDLGYPVTFKDIAKAAGVHPITVSKWSEKVERGENYDGKLYTNIISRLQGKQVELDEEIKEIEEKEANYDSLAYLKGRSADADRGLMQAVAAGKPEAIKLYKQLVGELVEKKEIQIGLSADERTRQNLEAERRLRAFRDGGGYRMEDVSEGLPLLPEEIRED